MAGLFYISTFIDLSDHLFKGTATDRHAPRVLLVGDAAVRLLHHRHRRAARRRGDHRRPDQEQRAHRDARLRDQPVSNGGAAAGRRDRRLAGALRARRADPRTGQPAGQRAELPDSRPESPHLRHLEPQVAHRGRRRAVPLPDLQPAAAGAERPHGAAFRPGGPRPGDGPGLRRFGHRGTRRQPGSAPVDRPRRLEPHLRSGDGRARVHPLRRDAAQPGSARDVRHRSTAAVADELRPAAHLHPGSAGQRLRRARGRGGPAPQDRLPARDAGDDPHRRPVRRHHRPSRRAVRCRGRHRAGAASTGR